MRTHLRSFITVGAVLVLGCQSSDLGPVSSSSTDTSPSSLGPSARGIPSQTITFEGFPNGAILSEVYGDGGAGPIVMSGHNPDLGDVNAAIIFDSANPLPAADDYDLGTPNETFGGPGVGGGGEMGQPYENGVELGNIMIVAENLIDADNDGNVDVPDDALTPDRQTRFDFTGVGTGVVTIHSITIIDVEPIEDAAMVTLLDAGMNVLGTFSLPHTGDNGVGVESLGPTAGVAYMIATVNGSGGIDNIEFTPNEPPTGGEGCTPGYWKNHEEDWVGYTPGQDISDMFSGVSNFPALASDDLMTGLEYGGGRGLEGMARNLLRIGIASVLNATSGDVNYPHSESDLINWVNDALGSGSRSTMESLKNDLDFTNNDLPCPL